MKGTPELIKKQGSDLTEKELRQINAAIFREFKVPPLSKEALQDRLFFLLKTSDEILAMGVLWEVTPVIYNNETFSILGVLNVVANSKGKGYGKQVVVAMREYAMEKDKTTFGFTMPKNTGFYEKCGFNIETTSIQRFVYRKEKKRVTNQDNQYIFYCDSSDRFMEKVLSSPNIEIQLPTEGLW